MTQQEVIKYLIQHAFISDEVKDMCIDALKKQMPKKPIYLTEDDSARCPTCNNLVDWKLYCDDCGQRIELSARKE